MTDIKHLSNFVGRSLELKLLSEQFSQNSSSIVVIQGRRRIGKSRLSAEFGKGTEYGKRKHYLSFSGLSPTPKTTEQDQLDKFCLELSKQTKSKKRLKADNWSTAFGLLTKRLPKTPVVILFDEISWMADKSETFIGTLKDWWDSTLSNRKQLMLILCGSVSIWIDENILKSTALYGRIALTINLPELSLKESHQLLIKQGFKSSSYDLFKILAVTGGVPWYLIQFKPRLSVDENLKRLCLLPKGLFVEEFGRIFHDLYEKRSHLYREIVLALTSGIKTQDQISVAIKYSNSGALTEYLNNLITAGFVTKHNNWSFKTGKLSRIPCYRLSDCYLRFYLHFILPKLPNIETGKFKNTMIASLPGWSSELARAVENLLLNHRDSLIEALEITPNEIVADNPYYQNPTKTRSGCQIDYLIQTRNRCLTACEFKFTTSTLGSELIEEMKKKEKALRMPRGYSFTPALFTLTAPADTVEKSHYFAQIINLEQLLA